MTRSVLLASALLCLSAAGAAALEQPPIQSPQDKACRDEATTRVFDTPDPQGLGPHAIGRTLYHACMARSEIVRKPVKTARRTRPAA